MNGIESVYTVKEIMKKDYIKVRDDETLRDVFNKMVKFYKDEVIIVNELDGLVGMFTKKDLYALENSNANFENKILNYVKTNIISVGPHESMVTVKKIMVENKIQCLPIVYNNKVIGLIKMEDLIYELYNNLQEMNDLQIEVLENLHEAVCIVNTAGIVKFWNKSSEELYGVSGKRIVGKPIEKFFPTALILKVLKNPVRIDNVYNESSPGKTVILSAVPIFNIKNELIAVVSTDRDVTEVIKLSKQLISEKSKVEFFESAYKNELASNYNFVSIMGKNAKIIENITIAKKVAPTSASILITGESGTGKEVFAKAIHKASGRSGNFVAINCSAIPENLFESEFFGYIGGTFTGSLKEGKIGKFEFASNGTIFLDEIGDMPQSMQAKLLRVLQDGMIYKIGSQKGINANVRIIAATNKNLEKMIKDGEFREDLFYRFAVVQIELPPLRDRKEDIKDFIDLFINQVCEKEGIKVTSIDKAIYTILSNYIWEGNIRELKNVVERMVVLSNNNQITVDAIPKYILNNKNPETVKNEKYDLNEVIEDTEKKLIIEVMQIADGNKKKAAEILKIKRSTLYYKLNQYNLNDLLNNI